MNYLAHLFTLSVVSFSFMLTQALAREVPSSGTVTEFLSPNGVVERCVRLPQVPGGIYSDGDIKKEQKFCEINFYDGYTALCPKTWSTSPATVVYDSQHSGHASAAELESRACKKQKGSGLKKLFKYKQSMNAHGTSGTFSTSSLVYYHLSRYFNAVVHVPVSVYREIDRQEHYRRVSAPGKRLTSRGMIAAGWDHMARAGLNPNSYVPTNHLFTDDRERLYGVLINGKGERYGTEINGVRSAWGDAQNYDFQKTSAFRSLRSSANISDAQTFYWARELSEIVIFDYILTQQDRVGNIDYIWYWVWLENGELKQMKSDSELPLAKKSQIKPPPEIALKRPVLLQKTQLNDNDAGTYRRYRNYAKRTAMLEGVRHIGGDTYEKLRDLAQDVESNGSLTRYFSTQFGLFEKDVYFINDNILKAYRILRGACENGSLRFELRPEEWMTQFLSGKQPASNLPAPRC